MRFDREPYDVTTRCGVGSAGILAGSDPNRVQATPRICDCTVCMVRPQSTSQRNTMNLITKLFNLQINHPLTSRKLPKTRKLFPKNCTVATHVFSAQRPTPAKPSLGVEPEVRLSSYSGFGAPHHRMRRLCDRCPMLQDNRSQGLCRNG